MGKIQKHPTSLKAPDYAEASSDKLSDRPKHRNTETQKHVLRFTPHDLYLSPKLRPSHGVSENPKSRIFSLFFLCSLFSILYFLFSVLYSLFSTLYSLPSGFPIVPPGEILSMVFFVHPVQNILIISISYRLRDRSSFCSAKEQGPGKRLVASPAPGFFLLCYVSSATPSGATGRE